MSVTIGQVQLSIANGTLRLFAKVGDVDIGFSVRRDPTNGNIWANVDVDGKKVYAGNVVVNHDIKTP